MADEGQKDNMSTESRPNRPDWAVNPRVIIGGKADEPQGQPNEIQRAKTRREEGVGNAWLRRRRQTPKQPNSAATD